jgi:AAA family ATP:ADP antiporter
MLVLFFLISFNYHLLRIAKDTLIITAPQSGAEVIPFLKVWAMLPAAFFFTFVLTRLSNRFNREQLFYVITSIFVIFFVVFALLIYPFKENLYLNSFADNLQAILPVGCKGLIAIIRYWMFSLFYVFAESWSTIMLSIMLWGFANDVINFSEAKRFYALLGVGINSSGIIAGKFGSVLATKMNYSSSSISSFSSFIGAKSSWDETFLLFLATIILCGIATIVIYRFIHIYIFKDRNLSIQDENTKTSVKKPKMSLRKTLKYVTKSKYLIYIAVVVLAYNVIINLTEVLWKSQMKELYPTANEYTAYMSKVTFFIGIVATLGSYFITGNLIRKLGWRLGALVTPIIFIITGIGFFYFTFLRQLAPNSNGIIAIFGMTPLALSVFFGSIQNVLGRASKYTVFDNTKEMAFIPLTAESRLKGKSAIDGIGSRLGKSGSSFFLTIMLMFFSTPIACSPLIAILICVIIPIWIFAINGLDKQFHSLTVKPKVTKPGQELPASST